MSNFDAVQFTTQLNASIGLPWAFYREYADHLESEGVKLPRDEENGIDWNAYAAANPDDQICVALYAKWSKS